MLKILFTLMASALLAWLTLSIGIANVVASSNPQLALKWWSSHAGAMARLGEMQLQSTSRAARSNAEDLARRAVEKDPIQPTSYLLFGLANADRPKVARAAILYSEKVSRRELTTQIWLIEDAVSRGDVEQALLHYDVALRTSRKAFDVLIPVLTSATGDKALLAPMARRLSTHPAWEKAFLIEAIGKGPSSVNLATLSELMARTRNPWTPDMIGLLITRLVSEGQFQIGKRLYETTFMARGGTQALVHNGDFESAGSATSFDWILLGDDDLWAARVAKGSGDHEFALGLGASAGRGGEVAKQILVLPPGRYVLSASAGGINDASSSRPGLSVVCETGTRPVLTRVPLGPAGEEGVAVKAVFAVPTAGCPAQRLSIDVQDDMDDNELTPWVDSIRIAASR